MFGINKDNHDLLSLAVAAVAVLLSQFQPIYKYFDDYDLEPRSINYMQILPHPYNGITLNVPITFGNSGEVKGAIHDVYAFVTQKKSSDSFVYRASDIKLPKKGQMMFNEWYEFYPQSIEPDDIWSKTLRFSKVSFSDSWYSLINKTRVDIRADNEIWCEDNYPACLEQNGLMYIPPKKFTTPVVDGVIQEHSWISEGSVKVVLLYIIGGVKPNEEVCQEYHAKIDEFDLSVLYEEVEFAVNGSASLSFDTIRPPVKTSFIRNCNSSTIKHAKAILSNL
ncbi:hypothetical protein F0223_16815 [Vibrio coralliilyticus]|uniref:hypothetical protein n=1 Tax=Vibrio TaxID=662 RepID=UPI00050234D6|nr:MULTISPECIES: hypothetical protein [Vibrio]KFI10854.1 hypothetical protein IX95_18625 [Vibrio sp. B183]NOI19891.1 hypothetical protein [Vibrio coralliilyticus]